MNDEAEQNGFSSDLYNSQSFCVCPYVRLSISFLTVFFGANGRMVIHSGVHRVNVYQT